MAQWIGICLPMQGTQVDPLSRIPYTSRQLSPCATTTKLVSYNTKHMCCNYWRPHAKSLCSTTSPCTAKRSPHSPQLESAHVRQQRLKQLNKIQDQYPQLEKSLAKSYISLGQLVAAISVYEKHHYQPSMSKVDLHSNCNSATCSVEGIRVNTTCTQSVGIM